MSAVDVRPDAPATPYAPPRRGAVAPRRPAPPRRPQQPARPLSDGGVVALVALGILAAMCCWFVLQVLALGGIAQGRAQHDLYGELREQLAAQTAPLGGAVDPGAPVAVLEIPTLGLTQVVVEGTAPSDLQTGPGHRRDTPLPGQRGVSVVMARATTYGATFRAVPTLRPGDGIRVTTGQGEFVYRVDRVRHGGDKVPALPSGSAVLQLVTLDPSGLGSGSVVYVDATLQDDPVVGPSGRPAAIPAEERTLGRDTSVLPALALVLQGLLAVAVGVVWLRNRLPGRVVWTLAAPLVVAGAWLATDLTSRLLPNLL